MTKQVTILLSTYNGEKYIRQQIESIFAQTYQNWVLLIRDDGSRDKTLEVINEFQKKERRIIIVQDSEVKIRDRGFGIEGKSGQSSTIKHELLTTYPNQNLGVVKNFEFLIRYASDNTNAQYCTFCDQDDVWMPDKLKLLLNKMEEQEKKSDKPILVHCDSYVTDEKLNIKGRFIRKNATPQGISYYFLRNIVQGCSMLINKKMIQEIIPFPSYIKNYDKYIHVIAELFGKRAYIDEPLMYYRQHTKNLIGATSLFSKIRLFIQTRVIFTQWERDMYETIYRFGKLAEKERKLFEDYLYITDISKGKISRIIRIFNTDVFIPWNKKLAYILLGK